AVRGPRCPGARFVRREGPLGIGPGEEALMTRWEAFALAARIGAAGPRYRVRRMCLRRARQAGHELVVEDRRHGETFVVRSERDRWERLHASAHGRREVGGPEKQDRRRITPRG